MYYYNSSKNMEDISGKSDFGECREGETDPVLGKKIHVLIENGYNFIVYLDTDYSIRYAISPGYGKIPETYGELLNRVAELEGLADTSFMTRKQIMEYRTMLGASIARMYENAPRPVVFEMVDKAENFLRQHVTETARTWYLIYASLLITASVAAVLIFNLLFAGWTEFLNYLNSGFSGGTGAYFSIIININKIGVNPSSGKRIHLIESGARLITGLIGGCIINMVSCSGIINTEFETAGRESIFLLSFAAGFSERMIPGMIHKLEGAILTGRKI